MKSYVVGIVEVLLMGVLIMLGVRATEWAIPAPEVRVIVCTMDDINRIETCRRAADLLKKSNN